MSSPYPLEPSQEQLEAMMALTTSFMSEFVRSLGDRSATAASTGGGLAGLSSAPAEEPGDFASLLKTLGAAVADTADTTGPGCFAYFPGGGLLTSAVAELLARTTNRYTSFGSMGGELVSMEHSVIQWLCREFAFPDTASGLVTTGASSGTLSALLAAREKILGGSSATGVIYVTEHTHHCVAKAAQIAGFTSSQLRVVPVTDELRMDAQAADELIAADRAAGEWPFLLVGTAGTTNTGAIDPLPELAEVARSQNLWFHVDAAYGGGFQLTGRGRAKLAGVEHADSIVLDAHKSLFLPYTTGVLLVRDIRSLHQAYATGGADYLQDLDLNLDLPNYADLGPELSREYRGLRLWLPLHLHGVGAFRAALDEKLDLSAVVHRELRTLPGVRTLTPDLTVHVFRVPGSDQVNRRLLDTINASGRALLTSTRLHGRSWLRMCVLNHRTHRRHVDEALQVIRDAILAVKPGS